MTPASSPTERSSAGNRILDPEGTRTYEPSASWSATKPGSPTASSSPGRSAIASVAAIVAPPRRTDASPSSENTTALLVCSARANREVPNIRAIHRGPAKKKTDCRGLLFRSKDHFIALLSDKLRHKGSLPTLPHTTATRLRRTKSFPKNPRPKIPQIGWVILDTFCPVRSAPLKRKSAPKCRVDTVVMGPHHAEW